MTFRVMAGFSAIWAGNARDLKDGAIVMTGKRYDVTDDVLAAAAIWLADKDAHSIVTAGGRRITLKVEVEEAEDERKRKRCSDCPHLYCEDPEFKDGPAVWKCDCKNGCVKEKEEEE